MILDSKDRSDDPVVFAREECLPAPEAGGTMLLDDLWKILVVDDEEDVHEITRITLKDYTFEGRKIKPFSAYSGDDVKKILEQEDDIALILMDVVMEEEDTGLRLVEYIREKLHNDAVRIVLRTGQPGKAPEQTVILQYDINDYKTKPEFTAQKLFTTVTACLRAYKNLKEIERNREGLESIIKASSIVFQHQSLPEFGFQVLDQLFGVLKLDREKDIDSAYFIGMPDTDLTLMAGTGIYSGKQGSLVDENLPDSLRLQCDKLSGMGGEIFLPEEYIGLFKSKEGFQSLLYLKTHKLTSHTDKYLLRTYANNIAIGFDNISLALEIIKTQKEVILILGELVETRSKETANHVTRVAESCYFLAKKSGMDEQAAQRLRLATPMHDVGKIAVPEAILNKPGKLTPEEFAIVKHHAQIGHEILSKSNRSIMKAAAIVAVQHHERWDGKGYPHGLSRENIHIFGRIAAIADVFDALSHKRCYKDAWPLDKIIEFFKDGSGTHFDPTLVKLFLANIDEFVEINKSFPE